MLLITYIQLSLFGKTSWERFLQMTGWTLEPSYPPSRTPKFQCLLREDGETPEWCEGERLMCAGGSWTPSIGQAPEGWHEGSGFFYIIQCHLAGEYLYMMTHIRISALYHRASFRLNISVILRQSCHVSTKAL